MSLLFLFLVFDATMFTKSESSCAQMDARQHENRYIQQSASHSPVLHVFAEDAKNIQVQVPAYHLDHTHYDVFQIYAESLLKANPVWNAKIEMFVLLEEISWCLKFYDSAGDWNLTEIMRQAEELPQEWQRELSRYDIWKDFQTRITKLSKEPRPAKHKGSSPTKMTQGPNPSAKSSKEPSPSQMSKEGSQIAPDDRVPRYIDEDSVIRMAEQEVQRKSPAEQVDASTPISSPRFSYISDQDVEIPFPAQHQIAMKIDTDIESAVNSQQFDTAHTILIKAFRDNIVTLEQFHSRKCRIVGLQLGFENKLGHPYLLPQLLGILPELATQEVAQDDIEMKDIQNGFWRSCILEQQVQFILLTKNWDLWSQVKKHLTADECHGIRDRFPVLEVW